jgi:hypothetical protein
MGMKPPPPRTPAPKDTLAYDGYVPPKIAPKPPKK